jgi:hypothetical protein
MDKIIADQDGCQESMGIVFHLLDQPIGRPFLFGQMNRPDFADGKQSSFRGREKSGK